MPHFAITALLTKPIEGTETFSYELMLLPIEARGEEEAESLATHFAENSFPDHKVVQMLGICMQDHIYVSRKVH